MIDQAFVSCGRRLQPTRQMSAITRASSGLSRGVDEFELLDRLIRGLIQFFARPPERIALYLLGEFFAVSGRAGIVGHQD